MTTVPDTLLKIKEVKEILQVSDWVIYELMDTGGLQFIRFGRARRVRLKDLEKLIQTGWAYQPKPRRLKRQRRSSARVPEVHVQLEAKPEKGDAQE